jgi:hypothetical protein
MSLGDHKERTMSQARELTAPERGRRETLRLMMKHADIFRNTSIIVLTAGRWVKGTIATTLGCSASTVYRVRRLYHL